MYVFLRILLPAALGWAGIIRLVYPWISRTVFSAVPDPEPYAYLAWLVLFLGTVVTLLIRPRGTSRDADGFPQLRAEYILMSGALALLWWVLYIARPQTIATLTELGIGSARLDPVLLTAVILASTGILFALTQFKPSERSAPIHAATIIICILLVPATFYVGTMAYYDATHIAGPIQDLLSGLPPLSAPSWYGFLPVILLSSVFRFLPLTLVNIYVILAAFETAGYVLFFLFSKRLLRSTPWAIFATVCAVVFHFLVQTGERNFYLQSTFFRFGIWLPVAFAYLHAAGNVRSRMARLALLASIAVATLWTTDTGLYSAGAFFVTALILSAGQGLMKFLQGSLTRLIPLMFAVTLGIGITHIAIGSVYGTIPRWENFWAFSSQYPTIPMFARPMTDSVFLWYPVFIALCSLAVVLPRLRFRRDPTDTTILYLSVLTLFMFTYVTGHSHPNSARNINLPAILCAVWLIRQILARALRQSTGMLIAAAVTVSFISAVPATVWIAQSATNLTQGNIITTLNSIRSPRGTEYDVVGPTAAAVKTKYAEAIKERNFAIISPWDSWYIVLWNTTNTLGSNCLLCYWTPEMAEPLIRRAPALTVRYLFVDISRTGYEGRVSWIFTPQVEKNWRFIERIGELDVYEKRTTDN